MSRCAQCAFPTNGPDDMCAHHVTGHADDWAMGNRVMCDFFHRRIVSPPERRAATVTIFSRLEPARDRR
jgi:hypothetical protein